MSSPSTVFVVVEDIKSYSQVVPSHLFRRQRVIEDGPEPLLFLIPIARRVWPCTLVGKEFVP